MKFQSWLRQAIQTSKHAQRVGVWSVLRAQPHVHHAGFIHWVDLPKVLHFTILSYLEPELLFCCAVVSPDLKQLSENESLWENHATQLYHGLEMEGILAARPKLKLESGDELCPGVAFGSGHRFQTWDSFRFFTLRLAWRELVARAAFTDDPTRLLVVLRGKLLDLTDFLHQHPGSPDILRSVAGCDATWRFQTAHRHSHYAQTLLDSWAVALSPNLIPGLQQGAPVPFRVKKAWDASLSCTSLRSQSYQLPPTHEPVSPSDGTQASQLCVTPTSSRPLPVPPSLQSECAPGHVSGSGGCCCHCGQLCREEYLFVQWARRTRLQEVEGVPLWPFSERRQRQVQEFKRQQQKIEQAMRRARKETPDFAAM